MLRAGSLRLLLPQEEVGAARYLGVRPEPSGEPGLFRLGDDPAGHYLAAISEQMTVLPEWPADRFVVAALGQGGEGLGWCWDELQVLIEVELQPRPVPAVLVSPHTPVEYYAEHAGELAYLCAATRLTEFALARREI
jgi:hypothetical protein